MSLDKKTWKIEFTHGSKTWSRIHRGESISVGSRLGNEFRLPSPCPNHLVKVAMEGKKIAYEMNEKAKATIKREGNSVLIDLHRSKSLRITNITGDEKLIPITMDKLNVHRSATLKDPTHKTLWYFFNDRLIETAPLLTTDQKKNCSAHLGSGLQVHLDNFTRKLIVKWATGEMKVLGLENLEDGLHTQEGQHRFLITSAPDLSQLNVNLKEKEEKRMAPVIFTVMATCLILLAILQFNWGPGEELLEEIIPEEQLAKLTIEKEKAGAPQDGGGGGGIQTEKRAAHGGAGVARPDEVVVKNINALASSSGNLLGALANLDAKYTNAAKAAIGPIGVGGQNPSQGILKTLGGMMGSGGSGVGIGGIGTRGFGGGGGGGGGLGFGTKVGNGVGDGKDLRAISFDSGAGDVRGGLEKSEVEAVIRQNIAQIRNCYNRGLRMNPTLSGKVKASFKIGSSGKVDSTRISDSTLGSSDVEECIRGRILSWNFPQPRGGSVVDVSYPFLLRPQ